MLGLVNHIYYIHHTNVSGHIWAEKTILARLVGGGGLSIISLYRSSLQTAKSHFHNLLYVMFTDEKK